MPNDFSVLIVEDEDDARKNMEDILSLDGYSVKSETHCLPAIEAVKSKSFDAVIVDWRLPDENADQLIPIIKQQLPNTAVVVITGMRDFDTAVTALRSGAYDFLLKPINPDLLRSILRRIVERKHHLIAIDEARKKLLVNERLAAIGQTVIGLAHESRNALQRSHACLAELELDLAEMPESLELVRKIQKAMDDIQCLLEEVRDYSAPIVLERRGTCLESLIQDTWQHIIEAKQIDSSTGFTIEKEGTFPPECFVDADRMRQVIRNLLENALFAKTDAGEVRVRLNFVNDTKNPLIRITVDDDGDGVPIADRETIFAPFITTKAKGTGLGLAVSRRIVEAHDGRIFVQDVDGVVSNGASFAIELPYTEKAVAQGER